MKIIFWSNLSATGWLKALLGFVLILILFIGYPLSAQAQNKNFFQVILDRFTSFHAQRTALGIPTGRPAGGAKRGRCPEIVSLGNAEDSLVALVPKLLNPLNQLEPLSKSSLDGDIVWGTTVAEYPTFWFFLPFHRQEDLEFAKFALMSEDKQLVAGPILVKLPEASGVTNGPVIAKFTLPSSENPLKVGQQYNYKWFFSIVCDARKPSRNPSVSGWIQRITPPFAIAQIQRAPTPRDYLYYAQSGIWYDAVTRLADSQMTRLQTQSGDTSDRVEPSPSESEAQTTSPQPQREVVPAGVKQASMPPLPSAKPLPFPESNVEDDWLGLFRFLFQSQELSEDAVNKIASKMAGVPIVELLPISER